MVLRSTFHESVIRDWFLMILSGKNPVIVEDKRYSEQGGYKVVEDPLDKMPPSQERRDAVFKELLNRIYGTPPAHVQLQAELNATLRHEAIGVEELVELSPQVLGSLTSLLRGALSAPPATKMIEAVATTPHPAVNAR